MAQTAVVSRQGVFDMQVCVPKDWTDEEVLAFANKEYPCGTKNGWVIRKEGDRLLEGDKERVTCEDRPKFVHIMLDA